MTGIAAKPTVYRGILFRSTLEADWAFVLDRLGIVWQYEPEAVRLPSGQAYLPDFYLPLITTWLEVKGPHDERLGKTLELAEAVTHRPNCPEDCDSGCGAAWDPYQLVVIGRAPVFGAADWAVIDPDTREIAAYCLYRCPDAGWWWEVTGCTSERCRACRAGDKDPEGKSYAPGDNLRWPLRGERR